MLRVCPSGTKSSFRTGQGSRLPLIFAGTELVEFSPTAALNETMGVVGKNLEAARAAGLAGGA